MNNIFISYARKDGGELAELLHERLTACGYNIWKDSHDLEVGENFPGGISNALEQSKEFIILLSPAALQSKWVMDEADMAMAARIKIFPIVFDGVANDSIPLMLRTKNYILTKGIDDWQTLNKLVDNLENGKEIPRVYSMSNREDVKIQGLLLLGKSGTVSAELSNPTDVAEKAEKMWRDFLPYWKNIDNIGLIPTGLAPLANTVLAYMAGKPNQLPRMYYPYPGPDKRFTVSADVFVELQQLRMKAQSES